MLGRLPLGMAVSGCENGCDDEGRVEDAPESAPCNGGLLSPADRVLDQLPVRAGSSVELIPGSAGSLSLGMLLLCLLLGFFAECAAGMIPIPSHGSRPDPVRNFSGTVSPEAVPCQRTA